jgi:nucleotide-binding universal stress UspA family protein
LVDVYTRILIPLDGSELSQQVVPYAGLLAKKLEIPVVLIRVIEPVPSQLADPAHGRYTDQVSASFEDQARESLNEVRTA